MATTEQAPLSDSSAASPPTRSPTKTSTPAGSAATGARPSSTSPRTPGSGGRSSPTSNARRRCGTTRCSSGARTRSPTTSPPTSTRRRARSRSTSSPPSRSTRPATPCSSSASCTRSPGSATARWPRAERGQAAAQPRLSQDLRAPRHDGRRTARRPLPRQTRRGGHALPHRDRGRARPARAAPDLQLPGGARHAARVPRGDAEHPGRRAAPHRLRRQAAGRPAPRRPRRRPQGRRPHPARRHPLHRPGADAPRLGRELPDRASATPSTRSAPKASTR